MWSRLPAADSAAFFFGKRAVRVCLSSFRIARWMCFLILLRLFVGLRAGGVCAPFFCCDPFRGSALWASACPGLFCRPWLLERLRWNLGGTFVFIEYWRVVPLLHLRHRAAHGMLAPAIRGHFCERITDHSNFPPRGRRARGCIVASFVEYFEAWTAFFEWMRGAFSFCS